MPAASSLPASDGTTGSSWRCRTRVAAFTSGRAGRATGGELDHDRPRVPRRQGPGLLEAQTEGQLIEQGQLALQGEIASLPVREPEAGTIPAHHCEASPQPLNQPSVPWVAPEDLD